MLKETQQGKKMAAMNRGYSLKHNCDGDKGAEDDTEAGNNGNQDLIYGGSDTKEKDTEGEDYTPSDPYELSEEGKAFLETVFTFKMKYLARQVKAAKFGIPDSKWVKCPELSPVEEPILSKEVVKQDKVAFRSQ